MSKGNPGGRHQQLQRHSALCPMTVILSTARLPGFWSFATAGLPGILGIMITIWRRRRKIQCFLQGPAEPSSRCQRDKIRSRLCRFFQPEAGLAVAEGSAGRFAEEGKRPQKCEEQIERLETRSQEIDAEMLRPEVCTDVARLQALAREKEQVEGRASA